MIDSKYKEHSVFKQLTDYSEFYESLSDSAVNFFKDGVWGAHNIDSYAFSSIRGTIESINNILIEGRIGDAYSLLRKYYDSILINVYSDLVLLDNFNLKNFVVEQIDKWIEGKVKMPGNNVISPYIHASHRLKDINALLYIDRRYHQIRDRCNDYTHYNFYHNLLLNDNELYLESRLKVLGVFSMDVENLFILHFAYLSTLNEHYMGSSDYMDWLEADMTPEEGSQYWVAPFIQKVFDYVIKTKRPDIAEEIKSKTSMKLE